jgi:hypothetical protein
LHKILGNFPKAVEKGPEIRNLARFDEVAGKPMLITFLACSVAMSLGGKGLLPGE